MKAMSILGIIFSSIFLLWFLAFVASPGIDKDEFAMVGVLFALWSLALSIVALVKRKRA